jgi:hypothetical protein
MSLQQPLLLLLRNNMEFKAAYEVSFFHSAFAINTVRLDKLLEDLEAVLNSIA